MMKCFFSLLFSVFCFYGFAQEGRVLYSVSKLPVRKGIIKEYKKTGCTSGGVEIISSTDSVFSIQDGMIVSVFNLLEEIVVTIKSKASIFFTFSNLKSTSLVKGDTIKKGEFIGVIKPNEDGSLHLPFMISNNKGSFYSQAMTVAFFENANRRSVQLNNLPVRNGSVYEEHPIGHCCYAGCQYLGVDILSKSDSVFSVLQGRIQGVFKVEQDSFLIVKCGSLFITYGYLKDISLRRGDVIEMGQFIGLIKANEANELSLNFVVSDKKCEWKERKTLEFLEKQVVTSYSNEQPIVVR